MYYIYLSIENTIPKAFVTVKPQNAPLIKICETWDEVQCAYEEFQNCGRKFLANNTNYNLKYAYGLVIGKEGKETLKCIECVEFNHRYGHDYGFLGLKKEYIELLPSKIILTTETNVEVLEEETNYFQNMDIYIWWNPNSFKQQSPTLFKEELLPITLTNQNPTEIEKKLYKYMGLYLIKDDEDSIIYAPIHLDNQEEFPVQVQIIEDEIEWKNRIVFDKMSKTVSFSSNDYYDSDMIAWILQRMEELNFKKFFKT